MRLRQLLAVVVLAVVAAVWAAPARADSTGAIAELGWWTKRAAAQPVPNGFEIAAGPDGVESVAAFRVNLTGSVDQASLAFAESTDENVAKVSGTPAIKLCTTSATWTAVEKGALDKAPAPDCSTSASMTVDANRKWTADITPLLAGKTGQVSVMALPELKSLAGLFDPGFNRQFGPPQLTVNGTAAPTIGSAPGSSLSAPSQQFAAANVFPTPPAAPVPMSANGTIAAPASAPAPSTQATFTTPQGVTIGTAHPSAKHWGRLVYYLPLAGLIGVGWVVAKKTVTPSAALAKSA